MFPVKTTATAARRNKNVVTRLFLISWIVIVVLLLISLNFDTCLASSNTDTDDKSCNAQGDGDKVCRPASSPAPVGARRPTKDKDNKKDKVNSVDSEWWRQPMQLLFPDKVFDGQFQNPKTEVVYDFDDVVMKHKPEPLEFIRDVVTYYPSSSHDDSDSNENDDSIIYLNTIFIPGLGQTESITCERSRRYAERLNVGIADLNNGSFLKDNPKFLGKKFNSQLDWIDATIHRLGFSNSLVIDNLVALILHTLKKAKAKGKGVVNDLNFSADSHGTILLGRALKKAKDVFVKEESSKLLSVKIPWINKRVGRGVKQAEREFRRLTNEYVNVVAFGNGYKNWIIGPKYLMIHVNTDPLVSKFGLSYDRAQKSGLTSNVELDDDYNIQFLIFESIFIDGSFEAHNMMYTIEMLRETFIKNNIDIGDFKTLYERLQEKNLDVITSKQALHHTFPWPKDMLHYTWDKENIPI